MVPLKRKSHFRHLATVWCPILIILNLYCIYKNTHAHTHFEQNVPLATDCCILGISKAHQAKPPNRTLSSQPGEREKPWSPGVKPNMVSTVDGNQKSGKKTSWCGSLSHYLQSFMHPRWFSRIAVPSTVFWVQFTESLLVSTWWGSSQHPFSTPSWTIFDMTRSSKKTRFFFSCSGPGKYQKRSNVPPSKVNEEWEGNLKQLERPLIFSKTAFLWFYMVFWYFPVL